MKKRLYIISALFLLLASSCTNELEIIKNEGQLTFSSINASMADLPTSRTHLENGGRVVWDVNDQVGIFSDTQTEPVPFTCTSVDDSKASFISSDEVSGSNFFAFYPYENCEIEGNELTYTLSSNTQYTEDTYFRQCPMIAKSNTSEFKFKHTCGIIRFSIIGTQRIQSLVLEGNNGEIIAGTGVVDLNNDTPIFAIPKDATNASTTITMSVGDLQLSSSATDFYFIIPETEFTQGLNLTINYLDENSQVTSLKKETQKSVFVSRSIMKSFSVFDADELIQEQEEERIYSALMAFYNATGGNNWTNNTNWGSDKPFGEWYGIYDYRNVGLAEEAFVLNLENNNLVGGIPKNGLSELKELTSICVDNNKLTYIQLSGNNNLYQLWCSNNEIKTLSVANTSVQEIICSNNSVSNIDVNNNPFLQTLICSENPITTLKIDSLFDLKILDCANCLISTLYLKNNNELQGLSCDANKLTSLDVSNLSKLHSLFCSANKLTSLDVSNLSKLHSLSCSDNNIVSLNISNNKELEDLSCFRCSLNELDVTGLRKLRSLLCGENNIKTIDVSNNPLLELLWCGINDLSSLDVSNNPKLYSLVCGNDIYPDGSIREGNNSIKELNTKNNPELSVLFCSANKLSSLDLSKNTKLEDFDCNSNNISTLDISQNRLLKELYCANNGISTLNVSNNDSLIHIECSQNNLKVIDVTKNLLLETLYCSYNKLEELDVSNNLSLLFLSCMYNPNLTKIYANSNQQFQYAKDETAEILYIGGGELPENPDIYTSTDYSKDGEVKTLQTATIGKGIDVILMGDAYSDRLIDDGTYNQTMNIAMEKFFSEEPYKSYRKCFNVYSVTVVSANEVYEKESSTAFSCYFGGGTHVGGDDPKVFTYAQKAISEDKIDDAVIIVMMNSSEYAGTCYMYYPTSGDYGKGASISYFPIGLDDTALGQVLQHEACGHGFAKLGDEYEVMFNTQIPESAIVYASEQEAFGWLKNIDFTSDITTVKWHKLLSDDRYLNEGIGVYEGAYTYERGAYRSTWKSIMRDNTGGFNAPSREAIYYRIHKLAYGEDWEYDYEKFVEYDAINRNSTASRSVGFKQMPPLHKPVIVNSSWKNAKSNVPDNSRTASHAKDNSINRSISKNASNSSLTKRATLSHQLLLNDGRTMITSIDADGKTKVEYVNVKQQFNHVKKKGK